MNIPKTFYITLRETPKREVHVVQQLESQGLKAEKFYGVNGIKLGLKPSNPDYIDSPHYEYYLTRGGVGCCLSHLSLWNMLLHYPDEEFFILEDDVIFCPDFKKKFEERYNSLPPWDLVYVGWVPYGQDDSGTDLGGGIFSNKINSGTHAYLVKKSILPILIEQCQPIITNIDIAIRIKALPMLKWFAFNPSLVSQLSTINNNNPTWFSTVYDWEIDGLNIKNGLLDNFGLGYGWYGVEKNIESNWSWTSKKFSVRVPVGTVKLIIECTSPIVNTLKTSSELSNEIKAGVNTLEIPLGEKTHVCFELEKFFVPSKENSSSMDNRNLGISVNRLKLQFDSQEIPFEIHQIPFSNIDLGKNVE